MIIALSQNEESKEFLKKLIDGFKETAESEGGFDKIANKNYFEVKEYENGKEVVKPFPSAIVADFAGNDIKGGAFSAPEEAFINLLNEAKKEILISLMLFMQF